MSASRHPHTADCAKVIGFDNSIDCDCLLGDSAAHRHARELYAFVRAHAAFLDEEANKILEKTGHYTGFEQPNTVQAARELLHKVHSTGGQRMSGKPVAPKIRFIVETLSNYPRNGGSQHLATVTSTVTGRSLRYMSNGPRNAAALVRRATSTWDCLHCTEQDVVSRQFNWAANGVIVYDYQVGEAHILALEVQP